jgi:hypothetical protein
LTGIPRFALVLALVACSNRAADPAGDGTAAAPEPDEIAQIVVQDLASPAFGRQHVAPSCVAVSTPAAAADGRQVVAARVRKGAGCAAADELVWIYVRSRGGPWTEEFLGAVTCWKDVPPELLDAVVRASGIAACAPESR